jgi:hypothetical protein
MGTKSNVNPDHYKTAGREKPGQDVVHEIHKQKYTQAQSGASGSEFIPDSKNAKPTAADGAADKGTGQAAESANSSSND